MMGVQVSKLINSIRISVFGYPLRYRVERDNKDRNGRLFIQIVYDAPCTKTGKTKEWHGRKWYLSEHMTDDEVIKTAYAAFEAAVKHEVMENFKVHGGVLFNPHIDYKELLKISHKEISRETV